MGGNDDVPLLLYIPCAAAVGAVPVDSDELSLAVLCYDEVRSALTAELRRPSAVDGRCIFQPQPSQMNGHEPASASAPE